MTGARMTASVPVQADRNVVLEARNMTRRFGD